MRYFGGRWCGVQTGEVRAFERCAVAGVRRGRGAFLKNLCWPAVVQPSV